MTLLLASPFFLQKPSGVAEVVGGGALAGGVSSSRTGCFFSDLRVQVIFSIVFHWGHIFA